MDVTVPSVANQPERDAIRAAIHVWLVRRAPSLGDLYLGALQLAYNVELPGRVRLVAHAVREICNSLPTYIAGAKGERVQYPELVGEIHLRWTESDLPFTTDELTNPIELQPVVSHPIVDLLGKHISASETAHQAAGRLFAAADPSGATDVATLRPLVDRWRSDTEWAVKIAHDPRKPSVLPSDDEVRHRFELFEDHLYGLSGPYFDILEEIDAILAQANS
jgi:hypothetical protein